ncbi:MAG: hypothetical protein ACKOQ4_16760 [Mycobacterium sp.]
MLETEDWDDVVDLLCVGAEPGPLAYGILCAAKGLDVIVVESAHLDPQTLDYRVAMTEDLEEDEPDPSLTLTCAAPAPPATGKRAVLEPFVGEELRRWSAACRRSPFGVLCTGVPDLEPMCDAGGRSITAGLIGGYRSDGGAPGPDLVRWLRDRAAGLLAPASDRLAGLILQEGRIAGAVLDDGGGPRRVGTCAGLALPVGSGPALWPDQPELAGVDAEVAVVGRRGGRFARVELIDARGRR